MIEIILFLFYTFAIGTGVAALAYLVSREIIRRVDKK